jgi:hypothetical protein
LDYNTFGIGDISNDMAEHQSPLSLLLPVAENSGLEPQQVAITSLTISFNSLSVIKSIAAAIKTSSCSH